MAHLVQAVVWKMCIRDRFQSVVLRLGLSVLLGNVLGWGYPGICLAEAVSPILPAILGLGYFFGGRWKKTLPPPKADTVWPNGNK